jgi:hypothetical protein
MHVWNCEQQLCAVQSLHGVPPDGQDGGAPQMFPLHCPLQHSDAIMHGVPSA